VGANPSEERDETLSLPGTLAPIPDGLIDTSFPLPQYSSDFASIVGNAATASDGFEDLFSTMADATLDYPGLSDALAVHEGEIAAAQADAAAVWEQSATDDSAALISSTDPLVKQYNVDNTGNPFAPAPPPPGGGTGGGGGGGGGGGATQFTYTFTAPGAFASGAQPMIIRMLNNTAKPVTVSFAGEDTGPGGGVDYYNLNPATIAPGQSHDLFYCWIVGPNDGALYSGSVKLSTDGPRGTISIGLSGTNQRSSPGRGNEIPTPQVVVINP
jgi:hypothetical protein